MRQELGGVVFTGTFAYAGGAVVLAGAVDNPGQELGRTAAAAVGLIFVASIGLAWCVPARCGDGSATTSSVTAVSNRGQVI